MSIVILSNWTINMARQYALGQIRSQLFTQLRVASVADAAGVNSVTWAATDYPRVFYGDKGYQGHRNRGRLPFLEFWLEGVDFQRNTTDGGTMTHRLTLRAHTGGRVIQDAQDTAYNIIIASLTSIRVASQATVDNYLQLGTETLDQFVESPWGFQQDANVDIIHSFNVTNTSSGYGGD